MAEIFTLGPFVVLGTHDKRVREHKGLIHDSPILMQIRPAKNHERGPSGSVRMAVHHALDTFATSLGTSLRGMRRSAKTLNLLRVPGAWIWTHRKIGCASVAFRPERCVVLLRSFINDPVTTKHADESNKNYLVGVT